MLEEYKNWSWNVPEIIAASAPGKAILKNDLVDRAPVKNWSKGAITLLGDAAHPTTPNFGQGACMAIEDAMVLTRNLLQKGILAEFSKGTDKSDTNELQVSLINRGHLANWQGGKPFLPFCFGKRLFEPRRNS